MLFRSPARCFRWVPVTTSNECDQAREDIRKGVTLRDGVVTGLSEFLDRRVENAVTQLLRWERNSQVGREVKTEIRDD